MARIGDDTVSAQVENLRLGRWRAHRTALDLAHVSSRDFGLRVRMRAVFPFTIVEPERLTVVSETRSFG